MDLSDMPYEVQLAFFVFGFLPDRWEGMSGTYLGKDWSSVGEVLNIYQVSEKKLVFTLCKHIERFSVQKAHEESERKRKRESSKGKNFTHNVKG